MTDSRANIKVSEETFEKLKAEKPKGVTWDYFLLQAVTTHPDYKLKERDL